MEKSPEISQEETPAKAVEDKPEKSVEETKAESDEEEEWVGPLPSEATEPQAKKRKILNHEKLFLEKWVIKTSLRSQIL